MSDTRHAKEKRDLGYLRDMSWEEDQRTLYHDLITPHRSYAFATPGPPSSGSINRWTSSPSGSRAQTSLAPSSAPRRSPQGQTSELNFPQPIENATVRHRKAGSPSGEGSGRPSRGDILEPVAERNRVFATSPSQVPTIPREKPQRQFKFKPKSMLVLSQEFYDQNASLQNDLVGPFHNPSKIKGIQYCGPQEKWRTVGRPIVRSMSTFEEYLERTVNTIRGDSEIAFHPSQTSVTKERFLPRRTKPETKTQHKLPMVSRRSASVGLDERLDFKAASQQLAMRAERSATSLGFSPAREVIDMHRLRAPWIVDPALFVRVFADAMPPESPGSPDSGIALQDARMYRDTADDNETPNGWFLTLR